MSSRLAVALAAAVMSTTVGLAGAGSASAEVVWLCKPGEQPNPCKESQRTTVQEPDGTSRVTDTPLPEAPPVDCFYVYPTVSEQLGVNADKSKDPELTAIARYQAARYSQECRVFAPVYRQLTLSSIYTGSTQARAAGRKIAFADVREAFREYLAKDNDGRGFVLVGHSQGTGMLRQLIREEVDAVPAVRDRLVSAVLLGGNVIVRRGQRAGGDFQNVPACASAAQLGCVIAFSTFDETPPDNARFGKAPATDVTGAGLPAGPDFEVLCTNPASLGANERRPLTSLLRSEPYPGIIGAGLVTTYGGPPPTAPTPWLQPGERYTGACAKLNGANVFLLQPIGNARNLNFFPTIDWGLHLTDANIALGELVDAVRAQAGAYAARKPVVPTARPRLILARSFGTGRLGTRVCARGRVTLRLAGTDRRLLKQADFRLGAVRVLLDRKAPFTVTVPRAVLKRGALARFSVRARLKDGRTATLRRALQICR